MDQMIKCVEDLNERVKIFSKDLKNGKGEIGNSVMIMANQAILAGMINILSKKMDNILYILEKNNV